MFQDFWFNMADCSWKHFLQIYNKTPKKIQKRCQLTLPQKTETEEVEVEEGNFCENLCSLGVGKAILSLTSKAEIIKIYRFGYKIIASFQHI